MKKPIKYTKTFYEAKQSAESFQQTTLQLMEKINENHELLVKSSNFYEGAKHVPANAEKNQGERFTAKVIHPKTQNLIIGSSIVSRID